MPYIQWSLRIPSLLNPWISFQDFVPTVLSTEGGTTAIYTTLGMPTTEWVSLAHTYVEPFCETVLMACLGDFFKGTYILGLYTNFTWYGLRGKREEGVCLSSHSPESFLD